MLKPTFFGKREVAKVEVVKRIIKPTPVYPSELRTSTKKNKSRLNVIVIFSAKDRREKEQK